MIAAGLAGAGWVVALATTVALARVWHLRRSTLEAVARARHELSGPLTAAQLALDLAHRRADGLTASRVRAIEREIGRAMLTLHDLDAAATGPARLRPRSLERVDLAALAADSVDAWLALAVAHRVRLEPPRCAGDAAVVLGDPVRLAQAAGNLIANAIEHGGGEVIVSCRCLAAVVRLEVSDGGEGLPAPVAELAVRPRRGRGARGRGLGIAAEVALAHGGRLSAAPAARGARLVLELPRAEEAAGISAGPAS